MSKKFKELSHILKAARAGVSQAELARKAGISNKTISDYERMNFGVNGSPDPSVLYRIAASLEADPSNWFKIAEMQYNASEAAAAIKYVNSRKDSNTGNITADVSKAFNTMDELRTSVSPTVRVGIVNSTKHYERFDREFAQALCGLINYDWKCDVIHLESTAEQIEAVNSFNNRCHVIMGIMETLPRTSCGLRFIPYPGVQYRLNFVCNDSSKHLSWLNIQEKMKDISLIVAEKDIGHEYVSSIIGSEAPNIFTIAKRTPDQFSKKIAELEALHSSRPVLICTGDDVCNEVLLSSQRMDRYLLTTLDTSSILTLPKFRVGAYVRHDDVEWYELVSIAINYGIRFASVKLADIYAELMSEIIPVENPTNHTFSFGRLTKIDNPSPEEFINQIKRLLPEKLKKRVFNEAHYEAITNYVLIDT